MATVRQLMVVQAARQLGLLQMSSNMFVRHLLHAGLEEVVLLQDASGMFQE